VRCGYYLLVFSCPGAGRGTVGRLLLQTLEETRDGRRLQVCNPIFQLFLSICVSKESPKPRTGQELEQIGTFIIRRVPWAATLGVVSNTTTTGSPNGHVRQRTETYPSLARSATPCGAPTCCKSKPDPRLNLVAAVDLGARSREGTKAGRALYAPVATSWKSTSVTSILTIGLCAISLLSGGCVQYEIRTNNV